MRNNITAVQPITISPMSRRASATVDLGAVRHNFGIVRKLVGKQVQIWPAVKANAYGHGALPITSALEKVGADGFCVATPAEALVIRDAAAGKPVLLLGAYLADECQDIVESGAECTVASISQAQVLGAASRRANTTVRVHLKIDTGMGRIGVSPQQTLDTVRQIDAIESVELCALMTHFASADCKQLSFATQQLETFIATGNQIKQTLQRDIAMHCANSAAVLALPASYLQIVRPGLMVYGCYPSENLQVASLQPVMTLKSRIIYIKDVGIGESISYGRTWIATRGSRIATVSIGYGDGLPRLLSNTGKALVHEKPAPIAGRICMDQTMIDVTEIPEAQVGAEVVFWGIQGNSAISVEEVGEQVGTIPYEITCGVSARVPREYTV